MKIKKLTTEQIKQRMDASPEPQAKWYQHCVEELRRRVIISNAQAIITAAQEKKKVIKHKHTPTKKVVVRKRDAFIVPTHNEKQKQSKLTLSPRVTKYI